MTPLRIAVAAAVVLAVALAAWEPWNDDASRGVAWRDLTSRVGPLALARPASRAFATELELHRFLRAQVAGPIPRLPPIDFPRERAVLVSPGPRSSTGYEVDVVEVSAARGTTVVVLRERTPSLGDEVEPRVNSPYRLLAVTTDETIAFRWLGRP